MPALTRELVERISERNAEPRWMRDLRLRALEVYQALPLPPDIEPALLDAVRYDDAAAAAAPSAAAPDEKTAAGAGALYESEVVYKNLKTEWARQGVIFTDTSTALREHADLVRAHFGSVVAPGDDKFAALNAAVFSGGSFVYVPPGVEVAYPLQTTFRINSADQGQFERTLIVVDEGARVHYVEGCTAPSESGEALHAPVVEIIVRRGARCQYTTLQNWSKNVFSIVAKRARAAEDATMRWVDANIGARLSRKRPAVHLAGRGARAEVLSVAFAGPGQHQDTGTSILHEAPNTTSSVVAKSVARGGGRATFHGALRVAPGARGAVVQSRCDALMLDERGACETIPVLEVETDDARVDHEASVSRIAEDQLFYLATRGIPARDARVMIVNGFIAPAVRELPMEYAVEVHRLVQSEILS